MEFNKQERNIRKILEERKIQPSDELWDKLEQQMKDQKRFSYSTLIKIAAIFIIVLSVGGIFYFNSSKDISEGIVKENSSPKSLEEDKEKIKVIPMINGDENKNETKIKLQKNIAISEKKIPKETLEESSKKSTVFSKNIKPKEKLEEEKIIAVKVDKEKENSFENPKIDQVLDSIEMELSLEEETLKLLVEAAEKTISEDKSKLDAEALLTEVDQELSKESDKNLRDKMHEMLKESWDKAKSALASNK